MKNLNCGKIEESVEFDPSGKYYFYMLVEPDTGSVFYVGKGNSHRISHLVRNEAVNNKVAEIMERLELSKSEALKEILKASLVSSDFEAYYREAEMYEKFVSSGKLLNESACFVETYRERYFSEIKNEVTAKDLLESSAEIELANNPKLGGVMDTPEKLCNKLIKPLIDVVIEKGKNVRILNVFSRDGSVTKRIVEVLKNHGFSDYEIHKSIIAYDDLDESKLLTTRHGVNMITGDFSTVNDKFDIVIGNPPYDNEFIAWSKHLNNACNLLKDGGKVVFLLPVYWKNRKHVKIDKMVGKGSFTSSEYLGQFNVFNVFVDLIIWKKGYFGETEFKTERCDFSSKFVFGKHFITEDEDLVNMVRDRENKTEIRAFDSTTDCAVDNEVFSEPRIVYDSTRGVGVVAPAPYSELVGKSYNHDTGELSETGEKGYRFLMPSENLDVLIYGTGKMLMSDEKYSLNLLRFFNSTSFAEIRFRIKGIASEGMYGMAYYQAETVSAAKIEENIEELLTREKWSK